MTEPVKNRIERTLQGYGGNYVQFNIIEPKPKEKYLPSDVKPPLDPNKEVIVVELSNLDKKTRAKVQKYDKNNDGILSNDPENKELNNVYSDMGLDLRKYATKGVTNVEHEFDYEMEFPEQAKDGSFRVQEDKTVLTYSDGHTTEIRKDDVYDTARHTLVEKGFSRIEKFKDGFEQSTYMDANYSISGRENKVKRQKNVTYNGEKGFTKETIQLEDGTLVTRYTRGWCHASEEYDTDDPRGAHKSKDFKQIIIVKNKEDKIPDVQTNKAKNPEEIWYFEDMWYYYMHTN